MPLGFTTYAKLERLLLRTRNILGEDDATLNENHKIQALQFAASYYNLYGGDGSELTYTDLANLTIMQSELIATRAAIVLIISAISYYKDDVTNANAGPAAASFRVDKLAWLREQLEELKELLEDLEGALGLGDGATDLGLVGLALKKVPACNDPIDDFCCD